MLVGVAMVLVATACGDNRPAILDAPSDGAFDATSDGAFDASPTSCGAAAGSFTTVAQGALLGADATHLYFWRDGLWTWPKAGGVPAPYPHVAPTERPYRFAAAGSWLYWVTGTANTLEIASATSGATHTITDSVPGRYIDGLAVLATGDAFVHWRCSGCTEPDRIDHVPPGATAAVTLRTSAAQYAISNLSTNGSVLLWDEPINGGRRIHRRAITGEVSTLVDVSTVDSFEPYAITAAELFVLNGGYMLEQRVLADGSLVASHPVARPIGLVGNEWVGAAAGMAFVLEPPGCVFGSISHSPSWLGRISLGNGSTEAVVSASELWFGIADGDAIYFATARTCCSAHGQTACYGSAEPEVLCYRP